MLDELLRVGNAFAPAPPAGAGPCRLRRAPAEHGRTDNELIPPCGRKLAFGAGEEGKAVDVHRALFETVGGPEERGMDDHDVVRRISALVDEEHHWNERTSASHLATTSAIACTTSRSPWTSAGTCYASGGLAAPPVKTPASPACVPRRPSRATSNEHTARDTADPSRRVSTMEAGRSGLRPVTEQPTIRVDRPGHRFMLDADSAMAQLVYATEPGRLVLVHTEVPEALGGRGIGGALVRAAVVRAAAERLTVVPWCPFARQWLQDHPDVAAAVSTSTGRHHHRSVTAQPECEGPP